MRLALDNRHERSYDALTMSRKVASQTQTCSNTACPKVQPLPIEQFAIRTDSGRRRAQCRDCVAARRSKHWFNNKETLSAWQKQHYEENKEAILAKNREYWFSTIEERKKWKREYYQSDEGKAVRNARKRARLKEDPEFKLKLRVSDRIRITLKTQGRKKRGKTWEHLPYTPEELTAHIAAQFTAPENLTSEGKQWMTWQNWTKYDPTTWDDNNPSTWTWELDHIKPHSDFRYKSMNSKVFRECWALSNLRPLSSKINNHDGVTRKRHKKPKS